MEEPSSSPSAAAHPESDRAAPFMELIQLYRIEHALLLKHQEETDRRRAAVRAAGVQEASEILLSARQEIRRVLVQTRRELVELSAQLRAVGCETTLGRSMGGDDFQVSVARDVRNVLRDARSELASLSDNAANLRPAGEEPRLLAPSVATEPRPEPAAADDFWSAPTHEASSRAADDSSEELPATLAEQFIAHWRIAAVAFVILVVVATAIMALRPSPGSTGSITQVPTLQGSATQGPPTNAAATGANGSLALDASARAGSEVLSLTLELRRSVWLRINADGAVDPGRTYQQGDRRTIQATREILLRAGDAGAVLVSLGDGAPVPLGPDGQVRTRRFARESGAATNQAGEAPISTRAAEVRPLAPASSVAAGTEPDALDSATVALRAGVRTSTTQQAEHPATAPDAAATAEREILERHQRWFDAFERRDRATMASLASDNFSLVDQRPERAPGAFGRVERTIHDLRVRVTAGIGAVLSGRISETTAADAPATVAMLSEVWIRRGEEWQLVSVRMVPLSAVPTTLQ